MAQGEEIRRIDLLLQKALDEGRRDFIIYPYGDIGRHVNWILNTAYGVAAKYIVDNRLSKYNGKINNSSLFGKINCEDYSLILACTGSKEVHDEIKEGIIPFFDEHHIIDLWGDTKHAGGKWHTTIGRHSYGPICHDHREIESIGAFCSFAYGVQVVPNHATDQLTTSPFIYAGEHVMGVHYDYEEFKAEAWYIEGLHPRECVKNRRIIIGNDVWLGHNTIITNGANIGNGVISGAGAIITKDVPDYAIVVGVPAYIIRYRYEPEEIAALNRIQWWNWSDEEIRARYDDLYLPIRQFIAKYDQK